eukprot:TRINITY_DN9968_c0_g1_i1.p1 TRINITY_DN9968_c0_g1~~TRINITY_DN9968_c0_g1_i1.p1  ORF type:complete len:743 (-),score=110.67 TRINITY_DN9968_c0_g1_i1:64-2292(-)
MPAALPATAKRPDLCDFLILEKLGEGSVGTVIKVRHKVSNSVYALKVVEKRRVLEHDLGTQLMQEVKTQLTVVHPNILRCLDYFEDNSACYLVLEYAEGGDLYQLLKRERLLCEPDAGHIFAQVADGLGCLHNIGIIHRDLKPENILLSEDLHVKVCDFGWCAKAKGRTTFCGTLCMLAPEMVAGRAYDGKVDVWAMGVVLFEMLAGFSPFDRGGSLMETCRNIVERGLDESLLEGLPLAVHSLLRGLLHRSAEKRISLSQAARHPWVLAQRDQRFASTLSLRQDVCLVSQSSARGETAEVLSTPLPGSAASAPWPNVMPTLTAASPAEISAAESPFAAPLTAVPCASSNTEVPLTEALLPPTAELLVPQLMPRVSAETRQEAVEGFTGGSSMIEPLHALQPQPISELAPQNDLHWVTPEKIEKKIGALPSDSRRGFLMSMSELDNRDCDEERSLPMAPPPTAHVALDDVTARLDEVKACLERTPGGHLRIPQTSLQILGNGGRPAVATAIADPFLQNHGPSCGSQENLKAAGPSQMRFVAASPNEKEASLHSRPSEPAQAPPLEINGSGREPHKTPPPHRQGHVADGLLTDTGEIPTTDARVPEIVVLGVRDQAPRAKAKTKTLKPTQQQAMPSLVPSQPAQEAVPLPVLSPPGGGLLPERPPQGDWFNQTLKWVGLGDSAPEPVPVEPINPRPSELDKRQRDMAKQLEALGFTRQQAYEALMRTSSPEAAVEWILAHSDR